MMSIMMGLLSATLADRALFFDDCLKSLVNTQRVEYLMT